MAASAGSALAHPDMFPPSEQPMAAIERAHSNDVLCGRGVTTNRHPGNEKFRALVTCNKELYVTSTKRQKMTISRSIVEAVRARKPPGRFLEKDVETGLWFDIGDKKAIEKTSQALRDGAASLRKQLSEDMSDPDFLDAVFDGVDPSDAVGVKGKPSFAKKHSFSKKSKPPVKKGHRRTNSSPAVTGRSNSGKRKLSSSEKAAMAAVPSLSAEDADSQRAALKRMNEASSGASSKPFRPDYRPTTQHHHKRTASAGAAPTHQSALFSRETQPGSPYPRQTPPTSPNPYMRRASPPASPYDYNRCLSLPTSPFPYHCPPTPPSPHTYGYAHAQSWDHQAPAPHKRHVSDPMRMRTPSPTVQNMELSRSRSRSFQEDYPMGPPPASPTLSRRSPVYQQRKSFQGWPPTSPRSYQCHPPSPRPPLPHSPRQHPPAPPHSYSPHQQHFYPNISPKFGKNPPPPPVSPRSDQIPDRGRPAALAIPSLGRESFGNGEVQSSRQWLRTPPSPRSHIDPHHHSKAYTRKHPTHTQSSWSQPPPDLPDSASSFCERRPSPRSMLRPARLHEENVRDPEHVTSHQVESMKEIEYESGPQDAENTAPRSHLSGKGSLDADDQPHDEIRKSFTFIGGQLMENDTAVSSSQCSSSKPMIEKVKVTPSPTNSPNSPEAVQAVENFDVPLANKTLDFGMAGFQPRHSSSKRIEETNDPANDILGDRSLSPLPFDHDEMHEDDPLLSLNDHVLFLSPPPSSSEPKALVQGFDDPSACSRGNYSQQGE